MSKKLYIICLFLLCCTAAIAQDFEIVSVEYLEPSMQAVDNKVTEQGSQGRECALLRITTENLSQKQQESFDFGYDMGSKVEKRASRDGEIWLWVTPGMRYLIIKGIGLGGSRELAFDDYGITIQSLKTYKIALRGKGNNNGGGDKEPTQQYLLFQLTPPSAMLEVNGRLWNVDAEGIAMKYVDFDTYSYRVMAPDYFTETGNVTVDDPENTKTVPVTLKPNFAEITLVVDADAEIWVNNQKKGVRTWTGPLGNGTYKIECKQANHETSMVSKEITPTMNGQTITLPAPTPIYGSLNIESTPNLATIYIDGKEVGKTPKSIPQIIIGQHEILLAKEDYIDYSQTIIVTKEKRTEIHATLGKQPMDDETFTVNGVSFTMKPVEGGTFQMGSDSDIHSVTLSSFYIGETEVTEALWKAVMGDSPYRSEGDNLPITGVTWFDCYEFTMKLSQLTGKNFRLPTEAEWEFAARGGKKSKGYKYAGSNNLESVAWYNNNNDYHVQPVMTKSPNELGLFDMSGNVSEWCYDWAGEYTESPSVNPKGPAYRPTLRVIRGGWFGINEQYCRVDNRDYKICGTSNNATGFRIVLCETRFTNNKDGNGNDKAIQKLSATIENKPEGALNGKFSVSFDKCVYFSKGNLQYRAATKTWRFAENQWDFVGTQVVKYSYNHPEGTIDGSDNSGISSSYNGWIDLFGWGTSGYHNNSDSDNEYYHPWDTAWPRSISRYNQYGYGPSTNMNSPSLIGNSAKYDWGVYNAISNGGNEKNMWRTLTEYEWYYVFFMRSTQTGIRYAKGQVNNVNGMILLPDDWDENIYVLNETNTPYAKYDSNIITLAQWNILQGAGAVFLPAAGERYKNKVDMANSFGYYWSSSDDDNNPTASYCLYFTDVSSLNPLHIYYRSSGLSVRLVCPVEN